MQSKPDFTGVALEAINLFKDTRKNLFITGKAGTGKSTLLEEIKSHINIDMVVLAPTGVAALNVGGETIHSFFKLKPGYELDEASNVKITEKMKKEYRTLDTLLIDEISMVRADIFDAMDVFLRRTRNSMDPFGGVRLILFGDLYQLPPVLNRDQKEEFLKQYDSPYFFAAEVFKPKDLFSPPFLIEKIELNKVYRQTEMEFVETLNAIREGEVEESHLDLLNKRVDKDYNPPADKQTIYLMTTNRAVNRVNESKLAAINESPITFEAKSQGNIGKIQPNDLEITVKKGAQVMFITNDAQKRWVNGSLGKVMGETTIFDEETGEPVDGLEILLENGKSISVTPYTWEISKYVFKNGWFRREALGYFTQLPLKLAWAITIHKSQGKTFDSVIIDLDSGSFAHGQTYVALSRCRSLGGTVLKRPVFKSDIIVDGRIKAFMRMED